MKMKKSIKIFIIFLIIILILGMGSAVVLFINENKQNKNSNILIPNNNAINEQTYDDNYKEERINDYIIKELGIMFDLSDKYKYKEGIETVIQFVRTDGNAVMNFTKDESSNKQIDDYTEECIEQIITQYHEIGNIEKDIIITNENQGRTLKYEYKGNILNQTILQHKNKYYIVTYIVKKELYNNYLKDYEGIISTIKFM